MGLSAQVAFDLPERLEAHATPEERGLARDDVRMLVARGSDGRLIHSRARDLPDFLRPGDLVVINTSATLPSALPAQRADGTALELRLSTPLPGAGRERRVDGTVGARRVDGSGRERRAGGSLRACEDRWVVELRDGNAPFKGARTGEVLDLPADATARLEAPYLSGQRLWAARLRLPEPLMSYLARHGAPIRYRYVPDAHPLADYQTAYAIEPGSAEMPSAGRPLTPAVLTALVAKGVSVAPLILHTGVSSPERGERPYPERYSVPASTARLVEATRRWSGRVIAVGTTVVRALETVARADGTIEGGEGWTALVVTPDRGVRAVDGLITGWHEPEASHLDILHAVAGRRLIERSYAAALQAGYLWHEFGDLHLIVP
ncbi:MAG: S-adenosylmethionine:tRNA ribosyltransferase-isomerase [Solirubrobacteraceae bacterium]